MIVVDSSVPNRNSLYLDHGLHILPKVKYDRGVRHFEHESPPIKQP